VSATVRVSCRAPMKQGIHAGHVIVAAEYGRHKRGRNGFDPTCQIDGLEHALQHPTIEKAGRLDTDWQRVWKPRKKQSQEGA
jgi:hypothetical protein